MPYSGAVRIRTSAPRPDILSQFKIHEIFQFSPACIHSIYTPQFLQPVPKWLPKRFDCDASIPLPYPMSDLLCTLLAPLPLQSQSLPNPPPRLRRPLAALQLPSKTALTLVLHYTTSRLHLPKMTLQKYGLPWLALPASRKKSPDCPAGFRRQYRTMQITNPLNEIYGV